MRIGAGISLLSTIVSLATIGSLKDDIRDDLEARGSTFTESEVDTIFNLGIAFGVVLGLIGVALWLWMAWANGRGKKWARVVATVFAALGLLSLLGSLTSPAVSTLSRLLALTSVAVGVASVVLLYRRDSSAFYEANSRR